MPSFRSRDAEEAQGAREWFTNRFGEDEERLTAAASEPDSESTGDPPDTLRERIIEDGGFSPSRRRGW